VNFSVTWIGFFWSFSVFFISDRFGVQPNLMQKMFLQLGHQKLDIYDVSRAFVKECYTLTKMFPQDERFALTQQIRRAAMSVHLNIAEGCSRKSLAERKRFFEISRGSLIEIDAALDSAADLNYCKKDDLQSLGLTMVRVFSMLSKMIGCQQP
jgi:four helix bundle protein